MQKRQDQTQLLCPVSVSDALVFRVFLLLTSIILLLFGHRVSAEEIAQELEGEDYDFPFNNERYNIQADLFDEHYRIVKDRVLNNREFALKSYGGSKAARKMVQMAFKGTWKMYKDVAIDYFMSTEDPQENKEFNQDDKVENKPEESVNANFFMNQKSLNYRLRVSTRKLVLTVSYDF